MPPRQNAFLAALGLLLLVGFTAIGSTLGFGAEAGSSILRISEPELRLWVFHLVMVVPGALLLVWGMGPGPVERASRFGAWLDGLGEARIAWLTALWFVLLAVIAVLGRSLVLDGQPVTDDENMVHFGARMVANGDLRVPILQPDGAFWVTFTYERDGFVSSLDYPGLQLFGALAIVTGLGSILYALAAASTGVAVAWAAGLVSGRRGAFVAALLWTFSPMALSLSMTTHAHLLSRCFISWSLVFYLLLTRGEARRPLFGALLGFSAGLAFMCRSLESAAILLPAAVHVVILAVRERDARRALLATLAGFAVPFLVYASYNHVLTGIWHLPARHAPGRVGLALKPQFTLVERIGTNLGFNTVIGVILGIGPLATAALLLAPLRLARVRVIALGLVLGMSLALGHNDTGIHVVGPIHFSDLLPAVIVLATAGLVYAGRNLFKPEAASAARLAALFAAYTVIGLGSLTACHLFGLSKQAEHQLWFPAALEAEGVERALVITEAPRHYVQKHPIAREAGSWVLYPPPPDPYLRDGIVYVKPDADIRALRKALPGWPIYSMRFHLGDRPDFGAPPVALKLLPKDFEGPLPETD